MTCDTNLDLEKFIQALTTAINQSLIARDLNPELKRKIQWLFQPRGAKDSSLDELEHE
jgi:hypothetical protein